MENEIILNKQTMTSLEIAELTGKKHCDVLRAIRNMEPAWEKVHESKFSLLQKTVETYNGGHKPQPYYELSKTECLYVATKFNDEARAKLVLRWEELEKANQPQLPTTYLEALKALVASEEQRQRLIEDSKAKDNEIIALSDQITEMQPKVSYYDKILASKATLTVTQVAQDYGMSAKAFNVLLRNLGIQRKVNGQWVLYAQYLLNGYVHSKSIDIIRHDGQHETKSNTEWTQKGRLFLYEVLKRHDVLPLIERG